MGREARKHKERVCPHCKTIFLFTGDQMRTHAGFCYRAAKLGLILPTGIVSPRTTIKRIIEPS